VEGERETLEMGVQLSAKIVDEPLTKGDSDVVATDAERAEESVDEDKHQAANEEEPPPPGFEVAQPQPEHGDACEDVIDNELEGPQCAPVRIQSNADGALAGMERQQGW
jgi:hypothetical protein